MSFDPLLDKYRPTKIDLLQIDPEGQDYRLLHLFDFDRYRPGIVQYESLHMCGLDCLCFKSSINSVCVQQTIVDRLDLGFAVAVLRRPARALS